MSEEDACFTAEQVRKRLSISTLVFWCFRPVGERSLQECARLGIRRIELVESREQFDMAQMRHVLDRFGVVSHCHSPICLSRSLCRLGHSRDPHLGFHICAAKCMQEASLFADIEDLAGEILVF